MRVPTVQTRPRLSSPATSLWRVVAGFTPGQRTRPGAASHCSPLQRHEYDLAELVSRYRVPLEVSSTSWRLLLPPYLDSGSRRIIQR